MMKKILMAAVALICMTMTSVVFSSCGDDKDDNKKTVVYYKYADLENIQCVQTEEGLAQAKEFAAELAAVLASIQSREVTDDDVINLTQRVVDMYNNKMIEGTFKLQTSRNTSDWSTLKRFTLTADPKYKN
jgi:hypothetical protein